MNIKTGTSLKKAGVEHHYSGTDFWIKLKHAATAAGRELVEKSLWLYYASRRPDTPAWAKAAVYSALAYFILPTDTIPDFIPGTGYTDDLAAILAAVATIANYIDDDVKLRAGTRLNHWFGGDQDS
ncbi:YkvA family protein [Porticoccus sp.]